MQQLAALLDKAQVVVQGHVPDVTIKAVTDDSRQCGAGVLFVAIRGVKVDGHEFLANVADKGSTIALVEGDDVRAPAGVTLIKVHNSRRALAQLSQAIVGSPSEAMQVYGVTGTNGKTTVTYLLESILKAAGKKVGVLTTVEYRWGEHHEVASHTTPSPTMLADLFSRMHADGIDTVVMEVSSHALDQYRVDGIHFAVAGFTNLTQDHLDYHQTMDVYRSAKERFFTELAQASPGCAAVLNGDDPTGEIFMQSSQASRKFDYGFASEKAAVRLLRLLNDSRGMVLDILAEGKPIKVRTPMRGFFNAQNILTAVAMAYGGGVDESAITEGLSEMRGAPGRFEFVDAGQPFPVIVDYAHTPDALLQVLLNARGYARRRLIVVFGCGGDRDTGKRRPMGVAAAQLGDYLFITNDNPRSEAPAQIAEAIVEGVESVERTGLQYEVVLDRREAIKRAVAQATPVDAIVIAGKGHEDYQILGDKRTHFDDREQAREALAAL